MCRRPNDVAQGIVLFRTPGGPRRGGNRAEENSGSEARAKRVKMAGLRARYETLTARERDVMSLVPRGLLNENPARQGHAEDARRPRSSNSFTWRKRLPCARSCLRVRDSSG